MEAAIRDRFNDNILHEAMRRFGIQEGHIIMLDGFESFMYRFDRAGEPFILRIGHSKRRSQTLIQGEVDWINYLAEGGAGVAKAILSQRNELVEAIEDGNGGYFLATAFTHARGAPVQRGGWTEDVLQNYGRLLGRMHSLSKTYAPRSADCQRMHWNDSVMLEAERFLPPKDGLILEHYRHLLEHFKSLPIDPANYGLIHQDAHPGNFFLDEDKQITLFDFDDCVYSWYANDLAIVLFYNIMYPKDADDIRKFLVPFFAGYRQENKLDPTWLAEFPNFLKLREIDLYAVIHRSFDVNDLDDDPWVTRFMQGRRQMLLENRPYHDFDYTTLAEHL
jgi:Ser/Thr protein kinase RdoA (MazF antagonist)